MYVVYSQQALAALPVSWAIFEVGAVVFPVLEMRGLKLCQAKWVVTV